MVDKKLKCILHKAIYLSIIFLLLNISFACNQNKPSSNSQTTDSQEQTKTIAIKTEQSKSSSDLIANIKQTTNKSVDKSQEKLPKLLDLGADKCIPCKMMKPILDELKTEYAGKLDVEFIDVWENNEAGQKYGISLIPTQIFYDPEGKEFQRHEGFISKEDILNTFKRKGMKLD